MELKRLVSGLLSAGVQARSIFYCSCEGFSHQDLRRLFTVGRRIAVGATGPFTWLLDEITSVPSGWPDLAKQLRDQTSLRSDIALLNRLSTALGSPLMASAVARDVGVRTHHRVLDRVEDLCQAFLAWRCFRARGGVPNPAAQWKLYFIDPVVAQLIARRDRRYSEPDRSVIAEQQLGLVLMRAMEREVPGSFIESSQVMHERTATGAEIDFVGANVGVAIESKYVDDGWKREVRTVEANHEQGIVVTRSAFDLDGPVWAVPAGMLAWLLDQ